jgi:hypothetical protein
MEERKSEVGGSRPSIQSVAIPFIMLKQDVNKFEINPEATEFLSQIKTKVAVVAICGKYRTGKSYILNRLFLDPLSQDRTRRGFQVGPTINPCTKGLWLWKEVFTSPTDDSLPLIIIDTEGLGAFDEDDNHDTKIFLLALLLCSHLIYNSVGSIDENVLNSLSLVVNLGKQLQVRKGQSIQDDEIAEYFPSFLWVLRDFALQLIDIDGNSISSK